MTAPARWLVIALCSLLIIVCFGVEVARWGHPDVAAIALYLGPLVGSCGLAIWAHVTRSRARWPSALCFLGGTPLFHLLLIPPSNILHDLTIGDLAERIAVVGLLALFGITVYSLIVKPAPPPPDPVARAVANE